jgi:PucR C-terminal helix-turn-helix domain
VTANLDTLLTALYVLIDDHVIPSGQRRPGRPKKLSDAELVCLAVAQVLLGARSEHHWLRLCYARLGHLFPYLPHQPGYELRDTLGVYIREQFSAARAARALYTHRNTVLNRLCRAERLLPLPLAGHGVEVGAALEIAQWLGTQPEPGSATRDR